MGYLPWILGAVVALLFGFLAPLGDYREELRSKLLGLRGFGRALFEKRQTSPFIGFFLAIFTIVRFLLELPLWVLYWAWRSYYYLVIPAITVGVVSLLFVTITLTGGLVATEAELGPWVHSATWLYLTIISLLFLVPVIWGCQTAMGSWTSGAKREGTQLKQK